MTTRDPFEVFEVFSCACDLPLVIARGEKPFPIGREWCHKCRAKIIPVTDREGIARSLARHLARKKLQIETQERWLLLSRLDLARLSAAAYMTERALKCKSA